MEEMGELIQLLQSYLRGTSTMEDCADWLASIDWDDPNLTKDEMEALGGLVLILTEISEEMREEPEFRQEVMDFIGARIGASQPLSPRA